jgi:cytochrome c oxidase subunit 2
MFQPGSPLAQPIADLFVLTLAIAVLVVVMIIGLVSTAWWRYRRRGEESEPEQITGHVKLETAWTVAPALLLAVLFVLTVGASRAADPPVTQNDQPGVVIIGHQWWW